MDESSKRCLAVVISLIFLVSLISNSYALTTDVSLEYDGNGNLVKDNKYFYEYNSLNELVRVKMGNAEGEVVAEYFYDEGGQRIKKVTYEDGEKTGTEYYIGGDFVREVNESGEFDTVYYRDGSALVGREDSDGVLYFYHPNHLGSTDIVTDATGKVVEETKYMPFGEVISGGDSKYLFTGQEKDQETDLMYYNARYYSPFLKHFTQADTVLPNIYDPQQLNRYSYVRNNPVKYVDPSGQILDTILDVGFIIYDLVTIIMDPLDATNWGSLGLDVGCALIPGVTGAGMVLRAADKAVDVARAVDKAADVARAADKVADVARAADKVADVARGVDKAADVARAADKVADVAKSADKVADVAKSADKVNDVKKASNAINNYPSPWSPPTKYGLNGPGEARQISADTIERVRMDFGHNGYPFPHWNQEIYKLDDLGKVASTKPIKNNHLPMEPQLPKKYWEGTKK